MTARKIVLEITKAEKELIIQAIQEAIGIDSWENAEREKTQ